MDLNDEARLGEIETANLWLHHRSGVGGRAMTHPSRKTACDYSQPVNEAGRAHDAGEWNTAELAAVPAVEIGERQVCTHLHRLAERGVVDVTTEGCGFVWRDDGSTG